MQVAEDMAQCSPDESEQLMQEVEQKAEKKICKCKRYIENLWLFKKICKCKRYIENSWLFKKICVCQRYIENSWMFKKICKYPVSIQICSNF